ncbi:MAG: inositol phosphorylceramide synthase [Gemmatimonadetes bacterium]|nr:inositol phosphorylceramide synthase [Gemmatimonadota bacterium]
MTTGVVRPSGREEHDRRERWAQSPLVKWCQDLAGGSDSPQRAKRQELGIRWWREILLIALFYVGYSIVRNRFGSAAVGPVHALNNADIVIELERALGLYFESAMQGWFLGWDAFISVWNVFYGLLHFSVTFFTMMWLYLKFPEVYQRWRTTGLVCTGLGLVGFALFPLMPPRLLGDCGPYGACLPDAGFVDTMVHYEGLWSFDSGTFQTLSNQYAAMPSIHFAWAFWCFLALRGRIRNGWGRLLLYLYPPLTLFAVVVTANHYWIDAAAGAACVLVALAWATPMVRWSQQYRARRLQRRRDNDENASTPAQRNAAH